MTATATVSRALYGEVCRIGRAMGYPSVSSTADGDRTRVPLFALLRVLEDLRRQGGDDDIGLRIGRLLNPACFAVTGYLVMAGPTLLDALPRISKFQRLVADGVELGIALDDRALRLTWHFITVEQPRAFIDLLMAGVRYFGVWLLGDEPPLIDVAFSYEKPACTDLHRELFGSGVRFGARHDGFALDRAWLRAPFCTADASLVPLLESYAAQLLAALRRDGGLAGISQAMVELIPTGDVSVAAVAARFGKSARTLQRQLRANRTTFNRLLQELRMDLANDHLARSDLSLYDIALRLGYREQSSFCHAYRQWTGRAPGDARRAAG